MKPILCDTCLNSKKEIKRETYGFYKKGIIRLNYFCSKKDKYIHRAEKYKCRYYLNRRLTDFVK